MALYAILCRTARASLGAVRARGTSSLAEGGGTSSLAEGGGTSSLAEGGGTCEARGVPSACPPCVTAPQPPCRARKSPASRGMRVVCCAPPQGERPPCPCPPPAPSLTCRDTVHEDCVSSKHTCLRYAQPPQNQPSGHCCDQDPVALRLQIAKNARRADYEWEVACRLAAPPAPPACPAPYTLGVERECARATDGCTYAVLSERCARAPARRCGPGRTPPPPRCVELAPDDACRIRGDVHLDPCAHRPRVMIEIDRSACTKSTSPPPSCLQANSSSCTTTTSAKAAPCTTSTSPPASSPQTNSSLCTIQTAPGCVTPRCRRPTIVERLRTRLPDCQSKRLNHTAVTLFKAEKSLSSVAGGLEDMLRSKKQLKEAGLGRVMTDAGAGRANHEKPPDGRLELSVPPGTERVAVYVSMTRAAGGSSASSPPTNLAKNTFTFDKSSAPCGPVVPPGVPSAPTRCRPCPDTKTKRCSSMPTFMADTIVVKP